MPAGVTGPEAAGVAAPPQPESATRRSWAPILAGAFVLAVHFWLVTQGTGRLFEPEPQGALYDAQAHSFLQGRWDVPYEAAEGEAFIRDGKCYIYFGPTPALFRLPFVLLFPDWDGRWARLSLLTASALTLLLAAGVLHRACRAADAACGPSPRESALFVLLIGLGSTLAYLASRASFYQEALVWAAALSLLACYAFLRYVEDPRGQRWVWASAGAAALSFFARNNSGAAPLLLWLIAGPLLWAGSLSPAPRALAARLCAALGLPSARPLRETFLPLFLTGALVIGAYLLQNEGKFGSPWQPMPLKLHEQYAADPSRLARMQDRLFIARNALATIPTYFSPTAIRVNLWFPWVHLTSRTVNPFGIESFDYARHFAGFPAAMPALFLLAVGGLLCLARYRNPAEAAFRLPCLVALLGGATILVFIAMDYRYLHDFFPALVLASAVGWAHLCAWPASRRRTAAFVALALLGLFSACANVAFAYEYQRAMVWTVPEERRAELRDLRATIAGWLEGPPPPLTSDWDALSTPDRASLLHQMAEVPVKGQLWTVRMHGTACTYTYDGKAWVSAAPSQFVLNVPLEADLAAAQGAVPLATIGSPDRGLLVYARCEPGRAWRLGCAARGQGGGEESPPLGERAPGPVRLLVQEDVLNRVLTIRWQGQTVLRCRMRLSYQDQYPLALGVNLPALPGIEPALGARVTLAP